MHITFNLKLLCAIFISTSVFAEIITIETMDKKTIQVDMDVLNLFVPQEYGPLGTQGRRRNANGEVSLEKVPAFKLEWLMKKSNEVKSLLVERGIENPTKKEVKESLVTILPIKDHEFMAQVLRLAIHLELNTLWTVCEEMAEKEKAMLDAYKVIAFREFALLMPMIAEKIREEWPEAFSETFKVWDS